MLYAVYSLERSILSLFLFFILSFSHSRLSYIPHAVHSLFVSVFFCAYNNREPNQSQWWRSPLYVPMPVCNVYYTVIVILFNSLLLLCFYSSFFYSRALIPFDFQWIFRFRWVFELLLCSFAEKATSVNTNTHTHMHTQYTQFTCMYGLVATKTNNHSTHCTLSYNGHDGIYYVSVDVNSCVGCFFSLLLSSLLFGAVVYLTPTGCVLLYGRVHI